MFKIFQGFHLIQSYQEKKKARRSEDKHVIARVIKLFVAIITALVLWNLPQGALGVELTIVEQRAVAVFAFATLMWLLEAIPAWTTSILIIVIMLLTMSESSLWFLKEASNGQELGTLLKAKDIMATWADPIIMLFLGGFMLAVAASKVGLDVLLAKALLKPFGSKSETVLLGFLLITGLFSMFVSNTATAAMMLTFLGPVLKSMPVDGKGRIGLALAIPIGANVGGIGTPIGTPPNAIALKYLNDPEGLNMGIGFDDWLFVMMPYAFLILFIAWFVLKTMFPFKKKNIEVNIEGEVQKGAHAYIVYITFAVTILMWCLEKVTQVDANTVAMIPIAVFCATGVITRRDLEEINWSVLWMVAGGFALGLALNKTGLAQTLITAIPFDTWSALLVLVASGLICWLLSNFISNTATAALLVPILALVGSSMEAQLASFGGISTLLIGIALAASLAMMLPISTPPNAIAHSTGLIEQKDMRNVGIIMGIIGLIVGYGLLILLGTIGYF